MNFVLFASGLDETVGGDTAVAIMVESTHVRNPSEHKLETVTGFL